MPIFAIFFVVFMQNKIMKKKKRKNLYQSKNDPLGAYTGTPADPFEKPVQDADDL